MNNSEYQREFFSGASAFKLNTNRGPSSGNNSAVSIEPPPPSCSPSIKRPRHTFEEKAWGASNRSDVLLAVVVPVYQDAASVSKLLTGLAEQFSQSGEHLHFLLIDDGSPDALTDNLRLTLLPEHHSVEIVRLRTNVGHQRAIALGIAYVHDTVFCDAMLIMDSDGEDRPEDAFHLVERVFETGCRAIVFAGRTRRSESSAFLISYRIFQLLHWALTGIRVRVGNFSVVPRRCLPALVALPALWNHYAAAVFHSRLPFTTLPTSRGCRYFGRSHMNFLALVMHGLQAISVFSHIVAVRILIAVLGLGALCLGSGLAIAIDQKVSWWAVYGWASLGVLLLLSVILGMFSLVLALISQRNSLGFLPIRDYKYFIEDVYCLHGRGSKNV